MKIFKALKIIRRFILALAILLLVIGLILSRYYVVDIPNKSERIEEVDFFSSGDDEMSDFLDKLEEFSPPLKINKEEFKKESMFN